MNKKEVSEIKRRLKKESCTITRVAGCYVDASKEKVLTFNETFLNLEDEEFHKYLELANKTLSGTINNNLVTLDFPLDEEVSGTTHQSLMAIRESKLKDDKILMPFYDHVIESYDYIGNYLILLFHDVYDVMSRTSDNMKLDESEESYEYILCAICPVILSKPGLGYIESENKIGPRVRDWVVAPTDTGFLFPAFTDRTTDIHSTLVYSKNANEPHKEFWEMGLGCPSKLTNSEKKSAFNNIVIQAVGPDNEDAKEIILDVQQNLNDYILDESEKVADDVEITLDKEAVEEIMKDAGISEDKSARIAKNFEEFFPEAPVAEDVLDTKAIKNNETRVEKKALQERVVDLTNQLEEAGVITKSGDEIDIFVKLDSARTDGIQATYVDGKKCICIPLEPDDRTSINGEIREL